MTIDRPNGVIAGHLAAAAVGCVPVEVCRFTTGSQHYVFEAKFADRAPVVVRMAAEHGRSALAGAYELSNLLRPLGVPLQRIIAEGLNHRFPHLVLERFPGTDLGHVIGDLSDASLETIAAKVARAQRATARTASARRYGYAVTPAQAPRDRWSQVLLDNLSRSRKRISAAGLFDVGAVDAVETMVVGARAELDAFEPIPFLHDTTTKNVIVAPGGELSGIVDVDDLCFGDPRYVIALTLASLAAFGGPVRYVDAWMKSAHHRDDRLFRLYVALFIVDFMSEHGQALNDNPPPSSTGDRNRLRRVFAESLQLAEA